ncbi:hypothetical protein JY572_17745 [Myxococcus landrumensis]|uniref:Porin n=1 Tax=Myxococcus landrumensis TaxID=2813577 RepID=A0ABX7NG30_9BACT|nr:hypothetical protein JY572_17745 [Myxococcus landrumus]
MPVLRPRVLLVTCLLHCSVAVASGWSQISPPSASEAVAPDDTANSQTGALTEDDLLRPATVTDESGPGEAEAPRGEATSTPHPFEEGMEPPRIDDSSPPASLTLRGFYFQRADVMVSRRGADDASAARPYFPGLVDVNLDFRPQDSIRAYAVGRLVYDPLSPELSTPRATLDRFWLYFGLFDQVFVMVGRQYIKWGSSRVWNTTDFMRAPNPDPLGVFDARQGVDMVKVNIPFESLRANLWMLATGTLEEAPGGDGKLPDVRYGGAVRAEIALGTSELIATAAFLERRRPRYGLDYSLGIGILDFNAEVALVHDSETRLWRETPEGFVERQVNGTQLQVSGGVAANFRLGDLHLAVARLEGFYNQLGDDNRRLLTWLQSMGDYRPLFLGRAYGLAQFSVTRRSVYEPSLTLTAMGNLGDPSFLGRLDFGFVRRNVSIAGYVEAPFGPRGGEFRFRPDPTVVDLPATDLDLLRVGMSLRLML